MTQTVGRAASRAQQSVRHVPGEGWMHTARFMRKYEKASGPFRACIQQELRHLREVMRTGNRLRYDSVEGLKDKTVRELEIGGGARLLAHIHGNEVTLLDVGDHNVVSRFQRGKTLRADLSSREPLPVGFLDSALLSLFPALDSRRPEILPRYANEIQPEWMYFLDDHQDVVFRQITSDVERALAHDQRHVAVVVGGPGTGKTSILLQLLVALGADVLPSRETWRVGLSVSDKVAKLIEGTTGWNLSVPRGHAESFLYDDEPLDVLLLDDPTSLEEISAAIEAGNDLENTVAVVAAFDPLQFRADATDQQFMDLVERHAATPSVLKNCYRMKREVGSLALKVVQAVDGSSPFLDQTKRISFAKERTLMSNFVNDMRLPNPSGYVRTQRGGELADWHEHLNWIVRQDTPSRAWEQLALVVAEDVKVSGEWRQAVAERSISFFEVPLGAVEEVKGLEFAHVAIFLTEARFRDAEAGFTGSGRRRYNDYRLLRIPFSRARDSVLVWVVPDPE